jgi:hypothetical protein
MVLVVGLASALWTAGCGNSASRSATGGAGTVTWLDGGLAAVPTANVIGYVGLFPVDAGSIFLEGDHYAYAVISNVQSCTTMPTPCANLNKLIVGVVSAAGPVMPGTYSSNIEALRQKFDANCGVTTGLDATEGPRSGTVTLIQAGPSRVQGSFDVILQSGTHLVGSFDAPVCNATATSAGRDQ